MRASITLREEEDKHPLLRAKVPISIFSLPFAASVTAGDPSDLALHLLTSFPSFPSLKLSYHHNPTIPTNPNPFTLTIKSGAGHIGSPSHSPLQISFQLSPNPNPSFYVTLKPSLGHFSLTKTSSSSSSSSDHNDPSYPKENGGGVHHPIPLASLSRGGIDEMIAGGVGVRVRTAVAVGRRAGLKVRWAVKLPPEARGPGIFGRLPYLTVDKISIERVAEDEEAVGENKREAKEWSDKDLEAMSGMCFWMGREAKEIRKESWSIKESIEALRTKFLAVKENCGMKNLENAGGAAAAGNSRGGSRGPSAGARRP